MMFNRPMVRGLTRDISRSITRGLINSGDNTLASILSSPVFQVDANLAASYPGSGQELFNVISSPANGGAKADYDFWLGADNTVTADDPAYSAGKFTLDGGDFFTIKTAPDWIKNLHRSDQSDKWWVAFAANIGAVSATQIAIGNTNGSSVNGFRLDLASSTGRVSFRRADGSTTVTSTMALGTAFGSGSAKLFVFTFDKGTRAYKAAINTRSFADTGTSGAFTNTAQSTGSFNIGTANGGSAKLLAGTELYGVAMGNDTLTDAQLSSLVDYYNALHGRTYA